ncbi:MGMT family protein [Bacillus cytotoxicus]
MSRGNSISKKVWEALYTIPYGTSASYLDIAKKIGNQKSCASNRWSE